MLTSNTHSMAESDDQFIISPTKQICSNADIVKQMNMVASHYKRLAFECIFVFATKGSHLKIQNHEWIEKRYCQPPKKSRPHAKKDISWSEIICVIKLNLSGRVFYL